MSNYRAVLVVGWIAVASPAAAQDGSSPCERAIQGRVAWNAQGNRQWDPADVARLCRGVESSNEPAICFSAILSAAPGMNPSAIVDLCEQTRSALATRSCFMGELRRGTAAADAIRRCDESTWTPCAAENGRCQFSGTRVVAYGAQGKYVSSTFTDGVDCTNAVFGDPVYGTVKACAIAPALAPAPPPQPQPQPPPPPQPQPPQPPPPQPDPRRSIGPSLPVQLGSCRVSFDAPAGWMANPDGTYSTSGEITGLGLPGTSVVLPLRSPSPHTIDPRRPSLSFLPTMLPFPSTGIFGDLIGGLDSDGPIQAGIRTGADIRRRMGDLFVDPNTSYLSADVSVPFVLSLDRNNRSSGQRTRRMSARPRPGLTTMGFAIDPCDPAVFFGGVAVNVSGVILELDGIGFSLNGRVHRTTTMPLWTGRTIGNQPELAPRTLDGHYYAKGTLGIGLGKGFALTGSLAATVNLDPRRDGAVGLAQAMQLLSNRLPDALPDVSVLLEGSMQFALLGLSVPLARGVLAFDSPDGHQLSVSVAGERRMGGSFADLFPGVTVPGANLLELQGAIQVYANASLDVRSPQTSGSYQAKLRGVVRVAGIQIDGDVDITVRGTAAPEVCVKLPAMGRLCGKEIERAVTKVVDTVSQAAVDSALATQRFFENAGSDLEAVTNDAARELGKLADAFVHKLHPSSQCKSESRSYGQRAGERLRRKATQWAMTYFDSVRPKFNGASPADRARAVAASYDRLYRLVLEKSQRIEANGRSRVSTWAVEAKSSRRYQTEFSTAYAGAVGDIRAVLADIYARPENVGQRW